MKKLINSKIEIFLINLVIILYLFKISFPPLKYPCFIIYAWLIIDILIFHEVELVSIFKKIFKIYSLVIMLFVIMLVEIVLSNKLYFIVLKDFSNASFVLSLFCILMIIVKEKENFDYFIYNFFRLILIFAILFSFFSLLFLFNIIPDYDILYNENGIRNLIDTTKVDYNFGLVPVFFGMLIIIFRMKNEISFSKSIIYSLILILFTVDIFLSGSRRGLFFLIFFLLLLSMVIIYTLFNRRTFGKFGLNSSIFFILLLIFSGGSFLFMSKASFKTKYSILTFIGVKNSNVTRQKIASNLFKCFTIIQKDITYSQFYNKIWSVRFDPKDPDLGDWGTRIHTTIYPLKGINVDIVPKGAKGYLMDSTCNCLSHKENFCESYSLIKEFDVNDGDICEASVFCFVSNEFNGKSACLGTDYYSINEGIVKGKAISYYDLNLKNTWQKLEIRFECRKGSVPILLSFLQDSVKDFSNLKGYVIFAYPKYFKIELENKSIKKIHQTSLLPDIFVVEDYRKLDYAIIKKIEKLAKIFRQDTTYYPTKNIYHLSDSSANAFLDRILRWEFGLKIFTQEYNIPKKLFGNGFNFINWYGYYFLNDNKANDWPHNPFLSTLLYSGLIGLAIYIFVLFKVFWLYLKFIKEYSIIFGFFLITLFFSFFSGGSPFDPPIMGFFMILPFFINYINHFDETRFKRK